MALSNARKVSVGTTPYDHEREALEFAFSVLPDSDPFHVWALTELLEPSTGRLYEIDLLVLGYSALYLVEIKSGPGRYEGDHLEWWRTPPGETRGRYMDGPLSLCNLKAKVLRSRLESKMKNPRACPYVEPLVFLSATDIDVRLKPEGRLGVVTRSELLPALQHHKFPGANPMWRGEKIARPVMHDVAQALAALGIRPRKGRAYVGSYELGDLIAEGPGYQDRLAKHRERDLYTRARVYLVPQQASVERRGQLRRAADREQAALWDVREHPNILRIADFVTDAPLGPTVLFDDFTGGVPLDAFLRQNPALTFEDRLTIVEKVGRALSYCHRKEIIHGGLSPQAVLVRRHPETNAIDVRLFNFQLAGGGQVEATAHWSALAQEDGAVYQAPELRENPLARTPQSDIFSLGALAYFIFTGRAPGERVEDVNRTLETARFLDPRAVDDGMRGQIAEIFEFATHVAPIQRADSVDEWLDILLDVVTAPEPVAAAEIDPLAASKDDVLGAGLEVVRVLGEGATARVLHVKRLADERQFALKVSSDPSHDPRLADEAKVLASLPKHPRIVELHGELTLGGRTCLLLSLAGDKTLQKKLSEYGPVSLDEASRYGDELLMALEHLEEHQVLHRDIKPANLGVGSVSKSADHLTLFDFSLARLPVSEVQVGTAVYRDPYLRTEGRSGWDFAADRWSAAVTLHEMLAGTRPSFAGGSALDPDARIAIATERFDAMVRDELVQFFTKALARSVTDRFGSAQEMRHAWVSVVGAPARTAKSRAKAKAPEPPPSDAALDSQLTDAAVAAIGGDTPVAALPLSARARNALDRAGLTRMDDLLGLAANRLSAIRGVGRLVAKEILEFRDRWSSLRAVAAEAAEPFFPGYAGDDLFVDTVGLDEAVAQALVDGGFPSLRALAQAPAVQVVALADKHRLDTGALRTRLRDESDRAGQRVQPTTLEGWVEAFLPRKKSRRLVRALFGLEAPFEGRLDVTVRELAAHEEKTTAAIYIAVGKARDDWAGHAALPELRAFAASVVEAAGGGAPLGALGEALLPRMAHGADAAPESLRAMAAALLRVVVEVDKEAVGSLRLHRMHDGGEPWLLASDDLGRVIHKLGRAADELAARATLAASGEVRRILGAIAEGSPLVAVKEERLLEIAAGASKSAACSARLEIYPRGLEPKRSVELCAATFTGGVSEEAVRSRVAVRYPAAAPLPPRPELDALLTPLGFAWDEAHRTYLRKGEDAGTSIGTRHSSLGRAATAMPSQARAMDAEAIDARQFDEKLKHAVEMNAFRVLGVTADRARDAALALQARLGAELVAFDVELAREIGVQMKKANIPKDDVVHLADREGPAGPHWPRLLTLVRAAAASLAERLTESDRPLLLAQPGPIARYGLTAFLEALVDHAAKRDTPAVFLLVPMHDTGGLPRIDGTMPIPGLLPGQALWISRAWLANRHNAAA